MLQVVVFWHIHAKMLGPYGHAACRQCDLCLKCGRHISLVIYINNMKCSLLAYLHYAYRFLVTWLMVVISYLDIYGYSSTNN